VDQNQRPMAVPGSDDDWGRPANPAPASPSAPAAASQAPPPPAPAADLPPPPDGPLPKGTRIAEYRIEEQIGQGGMGAVYRAHHTLLDRDVALKVIVPHLAADENFRGRFFREAKSAIGFVHRHAVPLRDFGVTPEGLYYMTMDFSQGEPLRKILDETPRLPPDRACRILRQALEALHDAHRKKIVHRDLKPDNIMIERDDEDGSDFVKVLDFGLAKILDKGEAALSDSSDSVIGTPGYMAPEQACGEDIDHRADIYACGIILYQCLSGRLPFEGRSPTQVILKHMKEVAPPIQSVAPDLTLPRGLEAVLMRALAKDRAARFQSAMSFADALAAYCAPKPAEVSPPALSPEPLAPAADPVAAPEEPEPLPIGALIIAGLLLGILITFIIVVLN
jgi:serine/threonine protein kinase